jgi:L-fucose isomerase-like protein
MDFSNEMQVYRSEFNRLKTETADVDFYIDQLVSTTAEVQTIKERLQQADGILVIHLSLGVRPVINEILSLGQPTMFFAVPFSGHEWSGLGRLRQEALGAKMECLLTSDYSQLVVALRPFRAIHHLHEAKILNLTTNPFDEYATNIKNKFGTEIKRVELQRILDLYRSVPDKQAQEETKHWINEAEMVVEPTEGDIFKSCKLALAFEKLLDEEKATVMTADCYGTMWDKTIKLPAYPCIGFTRLNNMGYGGICESDLKSAMTHIIFQGLSGRPGFISDPTVDESDNSLIMAHCLGTTRMDGPDKPAAPYKLRSVMERQEGVVPQVEMRRGQKVTQAILVGSDLLPYFTGEIIDAPVSLQDDRGCRTKIRVKVDGDVTRLWHNWSAGLHRQTCYGDITKELGYFCRFKDIRMVNEAV